MIRIIIAVFTLFSLISCEKSHIPDIQKSNPSITATIQIYKDSLKTKSMPQVAANINHFVFSLYLTSDMNNPITTFQTTNASQTSVNFTNVANGEYKVKAEAFSSPDNTVSITQVAPGQVGAIESTNTATVDNTSDTPVTYSAGNSLTIPLKLLDGTGGGISVSITPVGIAPHHYKIDLYRQNESGGILATYNTENSTPTTDATMKFTEIPDGAYKIKTQAYNTAGAGNPVGALITSVNFATVTNALTSYSGGGTALNVSIADQSGLITTIAGGWFGEGELAVDALIKVYEVIDVDNNGNI